MSSIYESIKSLWSKPTPQHKTSIYDERIKCFQTLIQIQKDLQSADEEYINVTIIEGKAHKNALNHMELYTAQYKKEYEMCEMIIKMK